MNQTNRKALGKGLEQLFASEQVDFNQFEKQIIESTPKKEIEEIDIDEIRSNPYQPRIHFDEEALNELAESIKEYGVLQPIIVKKSIKGYELIAGERRTKASKKAGLKTIPAIIKDFNDQEMMEIALLENIQRENLSPIEEAQAYKKFMKNMNMTQEEVANRFKKSRSYITNILGLLELPKEVQKDVIDKKISMSHARVLSKIEDEDKILDLVNQIKTNSLSVHQLEEISRTDTAIPKKHQLKKKEENVTSRHRVYETALRETIGTKITVSSNKIIIPFDSDADLDRIMEILDIKVGE
jgi:ParB family chromosome partitioning protein